MLFRSWCLGVAAIKNHTPPVFSCVVWLLSGTKSNNFRWLSTAKEAKILFFVPDINGEKFLPAHATREIFLSYLSPRLRGFPPFVVLSPAWSKLLFPLEHFSHPPFPFRRRARRVLVVRLAEACFDFGFSWLHVQVFPISW